MTPDKVVKAVLENLKKNKLIISADLKTLAKAKINAKIVFDLAVGYCENEPTEGNKKIKADMAVLQGQMKTIQTEFKASEEAFAEFKNTWEEIQTASEEVSVLKEMDKHTKVQALAFSDMIKPLKEKKAALVTARDAYFKSCQEKIAAIKAQLAPLQAKLEENKKVLDEAIKQLNAFDFGAEGAKTRERQFGITVERVLKGQKANSTSECNLFFEQNAQGNWAFKSCEITKQEVLFSAFNISHRMKETNPNNKTFILELVCAMAMNKLDIDKSNSSQTSHSTDTYNSNKQSTSNSNSSDVYHYDKNDESEFRASIDSKKSTYKESASNWSLRLGVDVDIAASLKADIAADLQVGVDAAIEGVDEILKIIAAIKGGNYEAPPKDEKSEDDTGKTTPAWQQWIEKIWGYLSSYAAMWKKIPKWIISLAKKIPYIGAVVSAVDFIFGLINAANKIVSVAKDIWNKLNGSDGPKKSDAPANLSGKGDGQIKIKLEIMLHVSARLSVDAKVKGNAGISLGFGSSSKSTEITKEKTDIQLNAERNVNVDVTRDINTNSNSNSSENSKREQNSTSNQSSFSTSEHDIETDVNFIVRLLCETTDDGKLKIVENGSTLGAVEKGLKLGKDLSYTFKFDKKELEGAL